jgi:hypothetical protein
LCATALLSQDIITLKTNEEIKAKVLEINDEEIKYKRFENLEGPQYTLKLSKVLKVRYENGFEEVFQVQEAPKVLSNEPYREIDPLPFMPVQIELDAGIGLPLGDFALSAGDNAGYARLGYYANISGTMPIARNFGVNLMASLHSNSLNRGDFQNSFFLGQVLDSKFSSVSGAYTSISLMPGISFQSNLERLRVRFGVNLGLNTLKAPEYNYSWVTPGTFLTTRYEFRPKSSLGFSSMVSAKFLYPLGAGHLSFNVNTLIRNNTITYNIKEIIGTEAFSNTLESTGTDDMTAIILGLGLGYVFNF